MESCKKNYDTSVACAARMTFRNSSYLIFWKFWLRFSPAILVLLRRICKVNRLSVTRIRCVNPSTDLVGLHKENRWSMIDYLGWVFWALVPLYWYDMVWHPSTTSEHRENRWSMIGFSGEWCEPWFRSAGMTPLHCDTVTHRENRWSMIDSSGVQCELWFHSVGMTPIYCV